MTGTELDRAVLWNAPSGRETFAELAETAVSVQGADLVSGSALAGVPFIITSIAFRPGDVKPSWSDDKAYYASAELVTADEAAFDKARKRGKIGPSCLVEPGEELIFNDGSAGVYRQLVEFCEKAGWIILPEGPEKGERGESRYDTIPAAWSLTKAGRSAVTVETGSGDDPRPVISAYVRLYAKRGLRVSEYSNDSAKDAATWYIA
jgi:hypothetical protein